MCIDAFAEHTQQKGRILGHKWPLETDEFITVKLDLECTQRGTVGCQAMDPSEQATGRTTSLRP